MHNVNIPKPSQHLREILEKCESLPLNDPSAIKSGVLSTLTIEQVEYCRTLFHFQNLQPVELEDRNTMELDKEKEIRKLIQKKIGKQNLIKHDINTNTILLYVMKLLRNSFYSSTKFVFDINILPFLTPSCLPNAALGIDRKQHILQVKSLSAILPGQYIRVSFYEQLCDDYQSRSDLLKKERCIVCSCIFCCHQKLEEEKKKPQCACGRRKPLTFIQFFILRSCCLSLLKIN